MRALMFGWEFPPCSSGGLGTACYGLTQGLVSQGVDVTFVMPTAFEGKIPQSHVKLIAADRIGDIKVDIVGVDSILSPYLSDDEYEVILSELEAKDASNSNTIYGKNLFAEVDRYAKLAPIVAKRCQHDIIHAHDWMTFPAACHAAHVSKKPLVVHVHATEFDRTGGNVNQCVYDIERMGMHRADKVIAVSNMTKSIIVKHYGVPPEKVEVVYNAVPKHDIPDINALPHISSRDKIVLFLGRITIQKGPDYFINAAKRVLEVEPDVKFVMAGNGDMTRRMIEHAANLGISKNVLFTGFLRGADVDRAYKLASLYVMPSISEPFGIAPLEALKQGTPVLISKQSGVSEVLDHCLKVDFWDIDKIANAIVGVLRHPSLREEIVDNGRKEVFRLDWNHSAHRCKEIYSSLINNVRA